jgi:hypothetical protein
MSKLICKVCKNGTLKWKDPEVNSLDGDMTCLNCGHVFCGMKDFISFGEPPIKDRKYYIDLISKHCGGMVNDVLFIKADELKELATILSEDKNED